MFDDLIEAAGFCLLIGFAYFVWPPATLLVAGVGLLLVANVRSARKEKAQAEAQGKPTTPGPVERLVRMWLASKAEPPR